MNKPLNVLEAVEAAEAARHASSCRAIRHAVEHDLLPASKPAGEWEILREDFSDWLQARARRRAV